MDFARPLPRCRYVQRALVHSVREDGPRSTFLGCVDAVVVHLASPRYGRREADAMAGLPNLTLFYLTPRFKGCYD